MSYGIRFRRGRLFCGAALTALAAAGLAAAPAQAQGASAAQEVDEVVVTGFRGSLREAIEVKRNAVGSVDAIVAEDIADFPDLNLAESIQRIPGVSIDRDAGEGRTISVRGLGPEYTRVRINGMEALATTGGTDSSGGTNRGRGFDFNVFASELFNAIIVRKTSAAEIEEGSLGATVDLQAARPFDYRGFTMAASGQLGYNDLSESTSPRGAFLISNTWGDGAFGALFSIAYSERNLLEEGHSTVRWQSGAMRCNLTPNDAAPSTPCPAAVNSAFTPRLPRYGVLEHDQKRLGITGSLQWRPTPATLVGLDLLYANLDSRRTENFLQVPAFSAGGAGGRAGIVVREFVLDNNNNLIFGRFDNATVRSEARLDELTTEFTQATLSLSHEFTDRLRVHALAGRSESDFRNPIQTTLLFDRDNANGTVYDYRGSDRLPLLTYGFDVNDPASWRLTQIRLRPQFANNTYTTAEANVIFDLDPNVTLKGGLNFRKYEFDTSELRRSIGNTSNQEANVPAAVAAIPISNYSRTISLADQWDIPAGTTLSWLIPDLGRAAELMDLYNPSVFRMGPEPALGNNRSVAEESRGGYFQVDFNFPVAAMQLRGNAGVRYVRTEQTSTGFQQAGPTPVSVTVNRTYDDALPSINLALEVTPQLMARASAAKVMVRPGLGSVSPGGNVTVSGNNRTVTSGNPFLDPTRGMAFDLSLEWYFAREGLLSLALFRKEIDSFVATEAITRPFTGNPLGIPDSVAVAACGTVAGCSPAADWVFNRPVNTKGGDVNGYEIAYAQPFTFLPGLGLPEWTGNFGVIANYTYITSEIEYPGGMIETLTGLSKRAYNATLYYEDQRFSARVSAAYRDRYLQQVPGRNGNAIEGTNDTLTIDAAASIHLTQNLSLTFEGLNLTDEPQSQFVDYTNRVYVHHHTGRQFFAGFRYRF